MALRVLIDLVNTGGGAPPAPEEFEGGDTLTLSDAIELNLSQVKSEQSDTITLSDDIVFSAEIPLGDGLTLSDNIEVNQPLLKLNLSDTLTLNDWKITKKPAYASKVVYGNSPYLFIVSNDDPASLIKVDISGVTPLWDIYNLDDEDVYLKNAQDVVVNDTFELVYIAGADGKIVQVDFNDLTDMTEIDLSDTDDLLTIGSVDDLKFIFTSTNNSTAELYKIDDRTTSNINLDFRFLKEWEKTFRTTFDYIFGKIINADFRFFATNKNKINTDFRFLTESYWELEPIPRYGSGFTVKIDDVSVTDVDMATIVIRHNADDISTAEFTLGRYHDKLDYMLDGTSSQITNQNNVKIYVEDVLQFEGKISELRTDAQNERVSIFAKSDDEWGKLIITKDLPIASLNERFHLYHALVRNVSIEHLDYATGVIVVTGLSCQAGKTVLTGSGFTEDVEGEVIDIVGGTNFINRGYVIKRYINSSTVELEEIPTTKDKVPTKTYQGGYYYVTYYTKNASGATGYVNLDPIVYRGIKVDLGEEEEERVSIHGMWYTPSGLAELIEAGDWSPFQNWTYFWRTSGEDFVNNRTWTRWYIGTSLAPIAGDTYEITEVLYNRQRIYDNWVTDLGCYYKGDYPYKEISTKNGRYIAKYRYEDGEDGLYKFIGERYDYVDYAQDVADLEYQKLLNINDDESPIVNANVDLTMNGYLYYGIKLLTRVNIVNTTQTDIYKNANGFPLSVKTIELNSADMLVHLTLDNKKSDYELEMIDEDYPEEPEVLPEYRWKVATKYDLPKWDEIE